ncbi:MAG: serine/threonine protein kinase, partial [Deltaproteobacteria bacterium]|nr:serine/threonine protein kinase [Deltaproteobacteria bacterium]
MQVTCANCGRSFIVDDARAEKLGAARCVCGVRLALAAGRRPSRPGAQALGKYDLLHRIAVGGMGEIFYAKIGGVEGFEREVAIKKMLPHLSEDRNFIDMLIKEAKLTVLLHHPNIVQVYDLAKEGKDYFIAMEYVPGVTVGSLLEQAHRAGKHLPYEIAVYITMQILRGLAYAHDLRGPDNQPMNLLHRDITPQNILVTKSGWVKITDFGIAKARNEISTTSPGMIKGKLGYIAPEQLAGQNPDQRVDIFCAGIVCWEALATRRLFKGTDEVDTFRLIAEAYVPPLAGIRADVPESIEETLRGALTKRPEDRYKTADEFYDALNQAIFPSTIDDYQNVTKRHFEEHPEFLSGIAHLTAETPLPTTEMPGIADDKLTEITDLARVAQGSRPRPALALVWVVLVLAGLA